MIRNKVYSKHVEFVLFCIVIFSIIPTTFFATTLIFVCFTLRALWAEERTFLYLGGKTILECLFRAVIEVAWKHKWLNKLLKYSICFYDGKNLKIKKKDTVNSRPLKIGNLGANSQLWFRK